MLEDLTEDPQPEVETEGGEPAVGNESVAEMSLAELNEALGKEYPDKETALKSIKDTFSYTGKRKEDIINEFKKTTNENELANKVSSLEGMLKESNFYAEHPEYKPYKDLVAKFGSPEEAIKDEGFQKTFKKLSAFDEAEKTKSVLHSNPKLGKITDKMTEAKTALAAGDRNKAGESAVAAVLEAYEK